MKRTFSLVGAIFKFFDKLEDKVRGRLSRYPIGYAIIGGIGTVLFWRGVWHIADALSVAYLPHNGVATGSLDLPSVFDGAVSAFIGLVCLLMTGLFVATFIGDHIIVSGLRHEKKVAEKTEAEVTEEENIIKKVHDELHTLNRKLEEIDKKMGDRKDTIGKQN